MKKIYEKALRMARQKVFDNEKYQKIISFCKYKLDKNVYVRQENTTISKSGTVLSCRAFSVGNGAQSFNDYLAKKELAKKTIYKTYFLT